MALRFPFRKESPDAGDVHVDTPLGPKKKKKKKALKKFSAAEGRTLYAARPVLNAADIIEHFKAQGLESVIYPEEMHVTVAFSKNPLVWDQDQFYHDQNIVVPDGPRMVSMFGDAMVMEIQAPALVQEWSEFIWHGATYSFPAYRPHITLNYTASEAAAEDIEPFRGPITLGPLVMQEIDVPDEFMEKYFNSNWSDKTSAAMSILKQHTQEGSVLRRDIVKVDEEQRIVWGWASVVMEKGQTVVDRQGHTITPDEMEKAANDFMSDVRLAKAMHQGDGVGEVIHSFILTDEICKAFDIQCDYRGWIIAMKIHSDEVWELVKSGDLSAFSIGGKGVLDDV